MSDPAQPRAVVLVRALPGSRQARQARAWVRERQAGRQHGVLVFLHGGAVAHAVEDGPACWRPRHEPGSLILEVCAASWRRRYDGRPPAPFAIGSLATFWARAIEAREFACFGAGHE
jgi:hypothetical protein